MFKVATQTDGHLQKTEQTKHLAAAFISEADKAVERINDDNSVSSYLLKMELDRQVSLIRQLAKDVMTNPSLVYESLINVSNEIEENSKHV